MAQLAEYLFHQEPGITLYCGDARALVPMLAADVLVTDPPYGINHPTDYASRQRAALAPCRDYAPVAGDHEPFDPAWLVTLGLPSILWGANHYASRLPDSPGWLVWDKERPDALDQATCELAWTNCIKGVRRFRYLWNGMIRAGNEALFHPTQKPVALMKWCLTLRWCPPGTVLDPYAGSGTTLIAAKEVGRSAIGIELSADYCEVVVNRLRQEVLALA